MPLGHGIPRWPLVIGPVVVGASVLRLTWVEILRRPTVSFEESPRDVQFACCPDSEPVNGPTITRSWLSLRGQWDLNLPRE